LSDPFGAIGKPVAITMVAIAILAVAFLLSGIYDIGADDHQTMPVLALFKLLRERSIAVRSSSVDAPDLEDPLKIVAGADRYSSLCASCHLAPGVLDTPIHLGLDPRAPNLTQFESSKTQRAFWIIKHGIKMSAMPAWRDSLRDEEIWDIVAFLRKMPLLSEEAYA
jgi:mono/diheme cytochrome c family protein